MIPLESQARIDKKTYEFAKYKYDLYCLSLPLSLVYIIKKKTSFHSYTYSHSEKRKKSLLIFYFSNHKSKPALRNPQIYITNNDSHCCSFCCCFC